MPKKTDLVVQDNKLIEASYRLTLIEKRIVLSAIVLARETQEGLGDGHVTVKAKWFAEQFGMNTTDVYKQLREAMDKLFGRFLIIHDTNPKTGNPRHTKLRWVSMASYVDKDGEVQFCFAQDLVPFITKLEKTFTAYTIEKISKMTSLYAIRLYELFIQWGKSGGRDVAIIWLKSVLTLEDEYKVFSELKRRVVDVAVKQINEHSDLTCSYTQRKTGRAVTHLLFEFKPKEEAKPKPAKKTPVKAAAKTPVAKPKVVAAEATAKPRSIPPEIKAALAKITGKKQADAPQAKPVPTSSRGRTRAELQAEYDALVKAR